MSLEGIGYLRGNPGPGTERGSGDGGGRWSGDVLDPRDELINAVSIRPE
jgi:hypothetical protein